MARTALTPEIGFFRHIALNVCFAGFCLIGSGGCVPKISEPKVVPVAAFPTPPAPNLEAGDFSLRRLTEVWFDELIAMAGDPVLAALSGKKISFSESAVRDEFANLKSDPAVCDWAILDNTSGDFAGRVILRDFDSEKNAIGLEICLAGERWFDQGIGGSTLDVVLTYALDGMLLDRVNAAVPTDNARAIRLLTKLGFQAGREFGRGQIRLQRFSLTKLQFIGAMAERLMGESLDTQKWQFGFDAGKRRAGLCDHTNRRISLSRHMSALHPVDQSRQVMFHEVAHALAGANHGHDQQWLRIATELGYRNERISGREVDAVHAKWLGVCPNGHEYFRYKKPTRVSSCSKCARGFDARYKISWTQRG